MEEEKGQLINKIEFKKPLKVKNGDKVEVFYNLFKVRRVEKNNRNIKFKTIVPPAV